MRWQRYAVGGDMTAAELRATAVDWLAAGRAASVIEIVAHRGSVPRETGTRMLVAPDAAVGTIGGGHLEWQAVAHARAGRGADWDVALGPALGQCCGGSMRLRFRPLDAAAMAEWPQPQPRFRLQLYGAGHVGRAIVKLLADIDCQVVWIDEREAQFPPGPLPPHVEQRSVDGVEAEVATAASGTLFLVLTHSHDLDLRITEAVLRRDDFAWLGLIGSASKRARFAHRLAQRGMSAPTLARMTCPIGLPGIAGKEPAVLALAAVAQLLSITSER